MVGGDTRIWIRTFSEKEKPYHKHCDHDGDRDTDNAKEEDERKDAQDKIEGHEE